MATLLYKLDSRSSQNFLTTQKQVTLKQFTQHFLQNSSLPTSARACKETGSTPGRHFQIPVIMILLSLMLLQTPLKRLRHSQTCVFSLPLGHHCGLGITSLLLSQRAQVRCPVGSISWLRFFQGFPSTVKQMSGNMGHIRPRLSYGHHISFKHISSVYGRRRSLTIFVVHGRR